MRDTDLDFESGVTLQPADALRLQRVEGSGFADPSGSLCEFEFRPA